MLNISHMKNRPIKIVLLWILGSIYGCYMPGGVFLVEPNKLNYLANDSIAIDLPIEYQVYNYFKVTYVKNKQVYPVSKQNDSTLVFSIDRKNIDSIYTPIRVEYGIVPFFQK